MTQTSVFLDFHFSDIPAETSSVALLQQHHSTIVHTVSPWRNIAHMGQLHQWPYIHTKPTLSTNAVNVDYSLRSRIIIAGRAFLQG